ncbi:hypothetical protein BDA99DRAFT_604465 [Phascolomyces articulosus]|uniref:Uncharacterized protein n=1 Tax=Phascolomyces articulosus TaxID=60185 RepID=A0AAD5KGA5_9FUNG|nr:hypothetical protein BDA99DRAFT_604465 [Phascolomyces articulosus]
MSDGLISFPTNIWTIHDVIIDTPVWKSNILHLEEQIDHFEKWVEGFMKALKQYIDAVIKYNAQTSHLCKKILPQNLDGSLIDPQVAGMIINTFASTLQCNLAFKTKIVSDLEDNLLHPLQRFVKHELKDFKESRKAYERMSDKYEAQIYKYNALSRAKEASALREDAFQTFDVRKTFIRVSREYFTHLLAFKANLEHVLVECFSSAMSAQIEEADEAYQSCTQSRAMFPGWQQWLEESKAMSEYQLEKISKASQQLENGIVRQLRPYRSLRNYTTPMNSGMVTSTPAADDASGLDQPSVSPRTSQISILGGGVGITTTDDQPVYSKEGYLFTRAVVGKPARYSWMRRWFFVQDGWFGACNVSTIDKVKGCVVIADRIKVSDCTCRTNNDVDRRFLFEVVTNNNSILLQAETEDELQQWIQTFENAQQQQQQSKDETEEAKNDIPEPLLISRSYLDINQFNTGPITMSNSPTLTALESQLSSRELVVPVQSTMSRLVSIMMKNRFSESSESINARYDSPDSLTSADHTNIPAEGDEPSTPPLPSLPRNSISTNPTTSAVASSSSWSMPWIMSGFLTSNGSNNSTDVSFYGTEGAGNGSIRGGSGNEDGGIVIFPTRVEMEASVVHLNGYSGELASRQRELRRLFANVPESEIVIEAFSASLYRQAGSGGSSTTEDGLPTAPPPITSSPTGYTSEYGYSGRGYVTQNRLWFYHCSLMTCLNTVIIPLDSIKSIRLEKALSNASHGMLMFVETKSAPPKTFCFGIWMEPAEVVGERLKMAIEAAKDPKKNDLQTLYDHMRAVIPGKVKPKRPTSHLMHARSLDAALTPLTVQAHPPSPQQQPSTEFINNNKSVPSVHDDSAEDSNNDNHPNQSHQQQQGVPKKASEESIKDPHRLSAAAGALTAAMEAANEQKQQQLQLQQQPSASSSSNTAERTNKKKKIYKSQQGRNGVMKPLPPGPVECDCTDHLDKIESKLQLPTSAEKLFLFMFSNKQSGPRAGKKSIWAKLNVTKQNSEPEITEWTTNAEGMKERTLKYVMPLNNPMVKTRETEVIETQRILTEDKQICYVIESSTKTPSLPYADAFVPCIRYCITYVSQNCCQLTCSLGVKWLKSIMVKTMVSRAATKGMTDTIRALVPLIEHDVLLLDPGNVPTIVNQQLLKPPPPSPHTDTLSPDKYRKQILIPSAGRLFIICVILLFCYALIKQFHPRSSSRQSGTENHSKDTTNTQMIWRAVFLRDLENGLIDRKQPLSSDTNKNNDSTFYQEQGGSITPPLEHVNPILYHSFEHRRDNKWFSMQHQLMGAELTYTRERLGALRYELLTAFRMLNMMDQRMLENEFWNWLLDERLRCEHRTYHDPQQQQQNDTTCDEISKQVKLS